MMATINVKWRNNWSTYDDGDGGSDVENNNDDDGKMHGQYEQYPYYNETVRILSLQPNEYNKDEFVHGARVVKFTMVTLGCVIQA
jgi:hypothetical protein